jgi:hypothetical protein
MQIGVFQDIEKPEFFSEYQKLVNRLIVKKSSKGKQPGGKR